MNHLFTPRTDELTHGQFVRLPGSNEPALVDWVEVGTEKNRRVVHFLHAEPVETHSLTLWSTNVKGAL